MLLPFSQQMKQNSNNATQLETHTYSRNWRRAARPSIQLILFEQKQKH